MLTTTRKPKIQSRRKLGHLWQVGYGMSLGSCNYGRATTQAEAVKIAKAAFMKQCEQREQRICKRLGIRDSKLNP